MASSASGIDEGQQSCSSRVRRLSSTDHEVEASSPEVASVQNLLLDAICAGLTMLRTLSPDLVEIASGDVQDHSQFEQLLGIAFSSPTFEQQVILKR